MTPKPESETDPWAKVRTFDVSTYGDCRMERDYYGEITSEQKYQRGEYAWVDEVDAARAAVERQHAAALAEKDAQIAELNNSLANEVLTVLAAENATLRAQVETLTAEIANAREACPAVRMQDNFDAPLLRLIQLEVGRGFNRDAECATLRASLAAVEGELDRLRERVARALCVENPDGPVSDDALVEAADATLTQLLEFSRSALAAVDAEEELDGPMPEAMRARFLASPETTMRSLVRVTKAGIRARLQAAIASSAPAALTPEPLTDAERLELQGVEALVMLPTFTARERDIALTVYRAVKSPPTAVASAPPAVWRDIETAPKDGALIQSRVQPPALSPVEPTPAEEPK